MNLQTPRPAEHEPVPQVLGQSFSLRHRLVLLLVCVLLALWGAVALDSLKSEQDAQAQMRQQTAALAMAFANHTEQTLLRGDHVLLQLRQEWLTSPKIFANAIARHQTLLGDTVIQIGVIAADGNLAYSNLTHMSERVDLSDREHFKVHREGGSIDRLFVSRPVKGRVSGKWSIQLTRPIFDGARFAGVVVLSLDPDYFVRYYQRFDLGEQGVISVVRDTGEVMARSTGQAQYIGKVINTAPVTEAGAPLAGSYNRGASETDGVPRLFSYYRLPERGLSVRIGVGAYEFLAPIRAQQRTAWLIASAMTLVLTGLGWVLLRGVKRLEAARNELATDRQSLSNILWGTGVGTWEWNVQSGETRFNARWAELIGYTLDELAPVSIATWMKFAHPDDLVGSGAALEQHFAGLTDAYEFEARMLHKQGHWIWVFDRGRVTSRSADGKPLWMSGTHFDITGRKLAEATLLKRTSELQRSNTELEQFSYSVSHDLRQPLRMVSSYLQLLQKGLGDTLDAAQREYFNFAIDGAKRMDAMMLGLLDYSRVGRKGEPPAWVESRAVLDEALLFLRPLVDEAQAQIQIEGDWPRVLASPDELLRLLQNLLGNALKFRVAGRAPQISVASSSAAGQWQVSITDNGVGIAPDQIGRLFQVFARLQSRAAYEGTGIGLALCRKIAEHHGGRIWAESEGEGQGSRFCISLPLAQDESMA
jgi:PAS domain S-box-containing protein